MRRLGLAVSLTHGRRPCLCLPPARPVTASCPPLHHDTVHAQASAVRAWRAIQAESHGAEEQSDSLQTRPWQRGLALFRPWWSAPYHLRSHDFIRASRARPQHLALAIVLASRACTHKSTTLIEVRLAPTSGAKDGVIGPACLRIAEIRIALQADGETRSASAASSIRRRSAAHPWKRVL